MLREVGQEEDRYHTIPQTWNLNTTQRNPSVKQKETHDVEHRLVVAKGERSGKDGLGGWDGRCKLLYTEWTDEQGPAV